MLEIVLPAAGKMPVNTPINDDRSKLTQLFKTITAALRCSIRALTPLVSVSFSRARTRS